VIVSTFLTYELMPAFPTGRNPRPPSIGLLNSKNLGRCMAKPSGVGADGFAFVPAPRRM